MNKIPNNKNNSESRHEQMLAVETVFETPGHLSVRCMESMSAYLPEFSQRLSRHDIYEFQHILNKLKAISESAELAAIAKALRHLQVKCVTAQDLVLNEIEIQQVIKEMTLACKNVLEPGRRKSA